MGQKWGKGEKQAQGLNEGVKAKATDGEWRNAERIECRSAGRAKTGGGIRE